jgi:hypothetical protein
LLGATVILGLQALLSSPPHVVAARLLQEFPIPPEDEWGRMFRDNAIYMALAGRSALKTALCFNFDIDPRHAVTGAYCMAVLGLYTLILPLWTKPVALLGAVAAPVLFMLVIALDTGRWLGMGVLNSWLLTAFFALRGHHGSFSTGAAGCRSGAHGGDVSHGTDDRQRGQSIHQPPDLHRPPLPVRGHRQSWMEHCDPGWEAVVHGRGR